MPLEEIGNFSISYLQILDEKGNADKKLVPKMSDEDLVKLYQGMFLSREADQRMLKLQRQGRIGTFGPGTGQEAAFCAPAMAMGKKDWFVGAFREPGARLMLGEPFSKALLYYNGYEEGNHFEGNERILPISVIVGSQCLHAAGIGYAINYRKEKNTAAVAFIGDGGTSQGDFYEGLNFAGVWKAPVVFIIQNNQWAISIPRSKQTNARTLAQKAIACGIPGIQVDGNDALAVYAATREALDRAYAGDGPTLIEAVTYRLMMHTTADDPKKYREPAEEEEAWKREPLIRYRLYLEKKGLWDDEKQAALAKKIKTEIDAGVKEFEAMTDFKTDAPFEHVFASKHEVIERQHADFLENLKAEAENA